MDLQTMVYQTVLQYSAQRWDARTAAAETIQRWWAAWRFIRANPRVVMVACVERGTSFRKTLRGMITYVFEDLVAQSVDNMAESNANLTYASANQMRREILRSVVAARTFHIMVAAKDAVAAADNSLIPTRWLVLQN
jgi:hypothetical protein